MKDAQARNEIDELKRKVFTLENKVENLEHRLDRQTHMIDVSSWNYSKGNTFQYKFPVKTAIELILQHLGLKIEVVEPQKEYIGLIKDFKE